MTDHEPPRLKSSGAAPEELVRALRALGREDRDAARLARAAERLSVSVAESASVGVLQKLLRWTGTKLGLTSLIMGLGALSALGYSLTRSDADSSVAAPAAPAPASTHTPIAPALMRAREPERAAQVSAPIAPATTPEHSIALRPKRRAPASGDLAAPITDEALAPTKPTEASALDQAPPSGASNAARAMLTPSDVTRPTQPAALAELLSEEALLLKAHKAAAHDPAAALRLLDQHAQRFAKGKLVPEREVLAIEALRRLGQNAAAERRLQQFKARYPQSIHLRRLERKAVAADDI